MLIRGFLVYMVANCKIRLSVCMWWTLTSAGETRRHAGDTRTRPLSRRAGEHARHISLQREGGGRVGGEGGGRKGGRGKRGREGGKG